MPEEYSLPADKKALLEIQARENETDSQWILKPKRSAKGKGIKILKTSQLKNVLKSNVVIGRYIANTALLNGFKFDLRLYVVVTSIDPQIVYIHE